MLLKEFFARGNQILFSGSILKLLFSNKGSIARIPYVIGVALLKLISIILLAIHPYTAFIVIGLVIYCWTALIQKRCRSFNSTGTWYILASYVFILLESLTINLDLSFIPPLKWCFYASVVFVLIANLLLILRPQKKEYDEKTKSFLTRCPIITTILMFIAIIGTYEIQNRYLPDTNRPAFHLGLAIGQIYRHTYMYPEFCKAHGYEMVHYPKKVREKFKEEIKIIEDDQMALLSNAQPNVYKNIEEFYSNSDSRSQEERFSTVSYLFERLRLHLIENQVAKEQNIDVRKVKLTEKDNERVSLKDACEVFDNDAEWFTSSDAPFNYILNYVRNYANCGTYYNTIGKVE